MDQMSAPTPALLLASFEILVIAHQVSLRQRLLFLTLRFKQQREKLACHFLAHRNRWNALEWRFIRGRHHTVGKDVDDDCSSRSISLVSKRTMHHQRMMKRGLAFPEFNRQRLKLFILLLIQ